MGSESTFAPPQPLNTAVLLLVFNRLDTAKQVFDSIRKARPPRLYIASDGPRESKPGEVEKVEAVRNYILSNIDWDCEVKTLLRAKNLGCRGAVSSAITWFFDKEEMGIILEDDCLPSQSFYWFAEEALIKYKKQENIYGITGDYRAPANPKLAHTVSLVSFPLIWGWATWRRVWEKYDVNMKTWTGDIESVSGLREKPKATKDYFKLVFDKTYGGLINTWDYQLAYQVLKNNAKFLAPNTNLISNIGLGNEATHTSSVFSFNVTHPAKECSFDVDTVVSNNYDTWLCRNAFTQKPFFIRLINKIARVVLGKNLIE